MRGNLMANLSLVMELTNLAVTQYHNFDFNSACAFGDTTLVASEGGLFTLDAESDNGTDIDSEFMLVVSDWGMANLKKLRSVFLGLETDGDLQLIVKNDESNERLYTIPFSYPEKKGFNMATKVAVGRDGMGRYWSLGLKNVAGAEFALDSIEVLAIIINRKPRF